MRERKERTRFSRKEERKRGTKKENCGMGEEFQLSSCFNFQGHIEERESVSERVSDGRKERKLSSHK